jgi:FlaA1/EpsC-like NDP-sugar epimerase
MRMAAGGQFAPFRRWVIVILHASLVAGGYWLAFVLRFELPLSSEDWWSFLVTLPLIVVLRLVGFWRLYLYEELWRYVCMRDILAILSAVTASSFAFAFLVLGLIDPNFPWPIFPIDWGVCLLFVGGTRLSLRAIREYRIRNREVSSQRALIIGAGDAGNC